jgi:hypothetical protein
MGILVVLVVTRGVESDENVYARVNRHEIVVPILFVLLFVLLVVILVRVLVRLDAHEALITKQSFKYYYILYIHSFIRYFSSRHFSFCSSSFKVSAIILETFKSNPLLCNHANNRLVFASLSSLR